MVLTGGVLNAGDVASLNESSNYKTAATKTSRQGCPQDVKSQDRDETETLNPQDRDETETFNLQDRNETRRSKKTYQDHSVAV